VEIISSPIQQEVLIGVHWGNVGDVVGDAVGKKQFFLLSDPLKILLGLVMTLPIQ
jgi:hypothetical protein